MLQQTQAQTVVPYFIRFTKRFPNIAALSKADEQEVLKYWEGLGYYSRARNIHKTALRLVAYNNGVFPADFQEILNLPGIGRYTAGAIASLAYNLAHPAVDANVLRVLSRFLNEAWQNGNTKNMHSAENILSHYYASQSFIKSGQNAADINESLIELGATVCTAKKPNCSNCPWNADCKSLREGTVGDRPLPKAKLKQNISEYTVLLIQNAKDQTFLVEQRPPTGLLASLWQFPMLDGTRAEDEVIRYLEDFDLTCHAIQELPSRLHVFSHLRWQLTVYLVKVEMLPELDAQASEFSESVDNYSLNELKQVWLDAKAVQALPFSAALFDYRSRISGESLLF